MSSEVKANLDCKDIQKQMDVLRKLKSDFDVAHHQKDFIKARDLKKRLEQAFLEIKQPLFLHIIETKKLLDTPVFEEYIARDIKEIDERTKVYIGPLKTDLFKHILPTIEYIYLDYPEVRIYREDLEVGGHSVEVIKAMFTKKGFKIGDLANKILNTPIFEQSLYTDPTCTELKQSEILNLIHITVEQLGFEDGATTQEIFTRAQELGLQLCPPSVGPYYRLQYTDQPKGEWRIIGMNPIDFGGPLFLFDVSRDTDDPWLNTSYGRPDYRWNPVRPFVFVAPSR